MAVLVGCGQQASPARDQPASALPPRTVSVAAVATTPMGRTVTVVGSLAAQDRATLSTKVAGRVHSIAVDLGTEVAEGQLIAQIDPVDYELQLRQAEALLAQARARLALPLEGDDDRIEPEQTSTVKQTRAVLDEAQKNRDRIRRLSQQGIISDSEVETADAAYEVALSRYQDALAEVRQRQALLIQRRAEVAIARQQWRDTRILAPFAGVVQERRASLGEYLTVGAPIATIVRVDPLRLRLLVPEREALAVRAGQPVRFTIEGDATVHTAEIKRLRPAINEQDLMLVVEAEVTNPGRLRPGAFTRASILVEEATRPLTVPPEALVTFAGVEKVFLVSSNRAVERVVVTGRRTSNAIELLSGVKLGDQVVLHPGGLQAGQAVALGPVSDRPAGSGAAEPPGGDAKAR